ncbi:MAG: YfgM family protein [Acidiferrobacterales bacterium]
MSEQYADEDQVEVLKAWWKEYGVAIIVGVTFGALFIGGYRYWNYYTDMQNGKASEIYEQVLSDISQGKLMSAEKSAKELISEYSSSPYLALTSLMLAKKYIDNKEYPKAKEYLNITINEGNENDIIHVARLRLARILFFQENNADEALALINTTETDGFSSQYNELLGDIYMSTGKTGDAIKSYQLALSSTSMSGDYKPVLQMKLDNAKSK